jgi:hypothetical protein
MKKPRLRVRHLLLLVAACAAFLAVFQYRREVFDPTFVSLRLARYGTAVQRRGGVEELAKCVPKEPGVVETLLDALTDSDPGVRADAARSVAIVMRRSLGPGNPPDPRMGAVKAALTPMLTDRDVAVRARAAEGLTVLGERSDEIYAILLDRARERSGGFSPD